MREVVALGQVPDVKLLRSTVGAGAEMACHLSDSIAERLRPVAHRGYHKWIADVFGNRKAKDYAGGAT